MIKVVIFEDNHNYRIGLYQLINGSEGFQCVGAYEDCTDLLQKIYEKQPDIVMMDIEMPGINGIEGVRILKEEFPNLKVMMQTIFEENEKIFQCFFLLNPGYIINFSQRVEHILSAIQVFDQYQLVLQLPLTEVIKSVF